MYLHALEFNSLLEMRARFSGRHLPIRRRSMRQPAMDTLSPGLTGGGLHVDVPPVLEAAVGEDFYGRFSLCLDIMSCVLLASLTPVLAAYQGTVGLFVFLVEGLGCVGSVSGSPLPLPQPPHTPTNNDCLGTQRPNYGACWGWDQVWDVVFLVLSWRASGSMREDEQPRKLATITSYSLNWLATESPTTHVHLQGARVWHVAGLL